MNNEDSTNVADECKAIDYSKRLPDTELEVMLAIWASKPPVTTAHLMKVTGCSHGWKAPTLISFLMRLEDRGYIYSEKKGKERYYYPIAERSLYIKAATTEFVNKYHGGEFISLIRTYYDDKKLSDADIDALLGWLKTKY